MQSKKMSVLFFLFFTFTCLLAAQTAVKKQIGKAGDWRGTIAGVGMNNLIYTVESSGALYATDPSTGSWKQFGKNDFASTVFMFAGDNQLFSIEKDGSLYAINPTDGSWKPIGKAGDWRGTIAGVGLAGRIYTVESSGALYATDPASGVWKQIGKSDFANTSIMLACSKKLFTIEKSGSLYAVNPADGSWKQLGSAGAWSNTIAAVGLNNLIYTVESSGALYATDPATGVWKQLGQTDFAGSKFMFSATDKLNIIDKNGDLFAIELGAGKGEIKTQGKSAPISNSSAAAVAGNLLFKFLGKWKGDAAAFENDPDYQKQIAANAEMAKGLLGMIGSMVMEVTLDGITMDIMGEKTGPVKYKVVTSSGNMLVIVDEDGPGKGQQAKIIFIDASHIKMVDKDNKAMYLKKI
jgi:hypothetical protein